MLYRKTLTPYNLIFNGNQGPYSCLVVSYHSPIGRVSVFVSNALVAIYLSIRWSSIRTWISVSFFFSIESGKTNPSSCLGRDQNHRVTYYRQYEHPFCFMGRRFERNIPRTKSISSCFLIVYFHPCCQSHVPSGLDGVDCVDCVDVWHTLMVSSSFSSSSTM